ncbi:autotransporter domain-containing protein [Comamonas sp. GB3 AK4-5]|uniref:autotransporter domain-containing protein n=1 Tax=Comamonas sp. GB3 AK4-5 TaxID=3231487 RepID=UPI00351F6B41
MFVGNNNNNVQAITNNNEIQGTVGSLLTPLPSLTGMAVEVRNGDYGTTTITNYGTISGSPLLGIAGIQPADIPVVGVTGGQVVMTNTGTITGRISFSAAPQGHIFTNKGRLTGSLSMGSGLSSNRFNAITGSVVEKGTGTSGKLLISGQDAYFAAAGVVDGGSGSNSTLALQNDVGGGTGTNGSGSISSDNFTNFSNLIVDAGTWRMSGAVLTGITSTVLNGGILSVDNNAALGSGAITSAGTGGNLQAGASTVALNNAISITGIGLDVSGSNTLILDGAITGGGALKKSGTGTLILNGSNSYASTTLAGGVTQLGNAGALSSGEVTVNGVSLLQNAVSMALANNIQLNSMLFMGGSFELTLNGTVSGGGSLIKAGAGTLTLNAASNYSGGTTIQGGKLAVKGQVVGPVTADRGTTLAGSGSVGSVGTTTTVQDGAILEPGIGGVGTLTVGGNLQMVNGSTLAITAGVPGANVQTPGQGTSVSVAGDLSLDGVRLRVSQGAGFGPGLYRLFDYGGKLTLNHGGFAAIPVGTGLQFLSNDKQINLVSTQGQTLSFWNADGLASSTAQGGGSGTWSTRALNWSDEQGSVMSAMSPQPGFAIFGGAAGTVTVNNFAGPVQTTGLQFASDGYQLAGNALTLVADTSTVVAPVEIRVGDGSAASSGWTATLNNEIAGSDGLKKTGAGTLVLNGINTYSGGTTVAAGTLSVSQDSNLGGSGEGVALDGGSLQITGTGLTSNGNRNWMLGNAGGGIDIADAANRFTLGSALSGTGSLTKTGVGTLVLAGINTYTGSTTVSGGTLALGSGGSLSASTALNVGSGATFDISQSGGNQAVGSLAGAGALALGSLTLDAGGNNQSTTYAGSISGTGGLTKSGTGALTLSGNSSGYTGSTQVEGGSLLLANTGQLGGTVTVASGATLVGSGTVGSLGTTTTVQSGAVIAAGDASTPYGTLHVAGDLKLEQGATYQVKADPNAASSSLIQVAGTATLAGSVLHVGSESNASTDFRVGQTYTILKASNILGAFDTVTSNYAYLDASLGHSATDVTLKLQRNDTAFAELANTSNQAAVANGIESLPSSHPLYQYVQGLPKGTPAEAFSSLSGDTHASVAGSLVSLGARAPRISSQHLYSNLTAGMRSGAPIAQGSGSLPASAWPSSKALPAWAEVVGHWQAYNGDGNAARLKQNTAGLFVGMDQEVAGSGWRLGGSLGYTHADGRVADRASTSKVDSYSAAVYGGKSLGTGSGPRINVLGGLAYTWHDIQTSRNVASLGQTLKSDYSAHTAQLFAEVGYAIGQYDKFGFEPFVGVSLGKQRTGSFQEHGGFAALQGRSNTDDLTSTTLGLRMHSDFELAGKESRLRATVGWRHAFGDVNPQKTMAFEGGQNFTVAGAPLARNTALLGLEAEMALSRSAALVVGYRGEVGSGQRDHAANVKVRWAF